MIAIVPRDSIGSGSKDAAQSATTALAANALRVGFQIQNQGTNPLFVYFGSSADSSSKYHFVLKAATGAADGSGGSFSMMGPVVYRGIVTIAGTSPSYSILEL